MWSKRWNVEQVVNGTNGPEKEGRAVCALFSNVYSV